MLDPYTQQKDYLFERVLGPNAECEYGRAHGFGRIQTIEDYQRQVPIVTYDDLAAPIQRMALGETGVLTTQTVRRFFATSGSGGSSKAIPVTSALIADKSRALGAFSSSLFRAHPRAERGRVVGNFSDSSGTACVPCGLPLSSEGSFWNAVGSATQKRGRTPLPRYIGEIEDPDSRLYTVARILVQEDVSLLMSLNPSTLLMLLRTISAQGERIAQDVCDGGLWDGALVEPKVRAFVRDTYRRDPERGKQLASLLAGSDFEARSLWPSLALVVCWRSPMQRPYLELLRPYLGALPQRDYLLMASEGVIAIPLQDEASGGALATPFQFFEFIPEAQAESPRPDLLLADDLQVGQKYLVVLSTSAGLYRYNIGDVVRVTGMRGRTPLVEFCYRAGATCSLTGEKLTETQVCRSLQLASAANSVDIEEFTLQPSSLGFPHYVLVVEAHPTPSRLQLQRLIDDFDQALSSQNMEYRQKRRSRRLGPPELWMASPGSYAGLRLSRLGSGANDAQIKPTRLTRDPSFASHFAVAQRLCAGQDEALTTGRNITSQAE